MESQAQSFPSRCAGCLHLALAGITLLRKKGHLYLAGLWSANLLDVEPGERLQVSDNPFAVLECNTVGMLSGNPVDPIHQSVLLLVLIGHQLGV